MVNKYINILNKSITYNDCGAFFLLVLINEYQNLRQGRYFHNIFSLVDSNCISDVIVLYMYFSLSVAKT